MNYEEVLKSAYQHHKVTDMSDIINALHYAQKEHELLGLYRRRPLYINSVQFDVIDKQIKALEKELEEMK